MEFPASDPLSAQPEPKLNQLFLPHSITLQPLTLTLDKFRIQPRRNNTMKTQNLLLKLLIVPAMLVAVCCSVPSAFAVSDTWDGGGANGNWDNITNWVLETTIPTAGQIATFNNNINTTISLNGADRGVAQLLFNAAGTGNYTFTATGAERFLLTTTVQIAAATALNPVVTFNVPISLGGNVSFNNTNTSAAAALIFNGNITNTATSTLTLTGNTVSALNKIAGIISDGTGVQSLIVSSAVAGSVWELSNDNTFTGTVAKSGAGTLILSGSNAYTGATTVSAGILNVRHANALGTTAGGTTVSAAGSLQLQGGISVGAEALTLNATSTAVIALRNISGINTYGGAITLSAAGRINSDAGTLTLNNGITGPFGLVVGGVGDTTISGVIGTGVGGLTKDGAGLLTLSGSNTYTGVTTISGGIVSVNTLTNTTSANALGQSSNVAANLVLGNASAVTTLRYTGSATTTDRLFTFNSSSTVLSLDASGSGAIEFTNTGSMAYGVNTNTSARNLTLTGTNTGNNTLAAVIADRAGGGATGIIKSGDGTWVLSGSNSYTGATLVNVGTLLINGNQSSATGSVSVSANATLGGSGTIGGATSIADNGILAPGTIGDSTSTLSFNNNNLTLSGVNTKLNLDITGTIAGAFDKLSGINTFAMNGDITFNLTGSYVAASWDVADFSSRSGNFDTVTLAGNYSGNLSRNDNTWTGNFSGQDWTFEQTTGLLSVVPEPSTWVLLAFGLTFIVVMRRRRA